MVRDAPMTRASDIDPEQLGNILNLFTRAYLIYSKQYYTTNLKPAQNRSCSYLKDSYLID